MTSNDTKRPSAKTAMLIRKPVNEVFDAFIEPAITTKFWFTRSTGKLEPGKHIEWFWEMYNVSVQVIVEQLITNEKILIRWGNYGHMTTVEWTFKEILGEGTHVAIVNDGFEDSPALIEQISDSTKGFTFFLAGLKAWLEYGIQLNLVADAFPVGRV